MAKLFSFTRLTASGTFEKVTWFKNADGSKHSTSEMVIVTPEMALTIAQSKYQEIYN